MILRNLSRVKETCRAILICFAVGAVNFTAVQQGAFGKSKAVAPAPATAADGPVYPVSNLVVAYKAQHSGLPKISSLPVRIELGLASDGFVAPSPKYRSVQFRLADLEATVKTPRSFHASALRVMGEQIVHALNKTGLVGVFVAPDATEIAPTDGSDQRPVDQNAITLLIYVSQVKEIRTVASGSRLPDSAKVNNPAHAYILNNSPVKPATPSGALQPGTTDLLKKDTLDDYVFRLNRQPGRRVDVAVSGADEPGAVDLDYLVAETRPWFAFFELSNTGTRETSVWREHFGYTNNQFTGHDDILTLDYSTADFSRSQDIYTSYDFPIAGVYKLRGRIYGTYDDFTASDVGFINQRFNGEEVIGGGELSVNLLQHRDAFLDAFGGARFQRERVDNIVPDESFNKNLDRGEGAFVVPYAGVRFTRSSETTTSSASAQAIYGTTVQTDNLDGLRTGASNSFLLIQADVARSFFLEPLLNPSAFKSGNSGTLANEISFSGRGQYSPTDSRLVPEVEATVGGFYSVRGYPESVAAGDASLVGSLEYRYHIPRGLAVRPGVPESKIFGQPFRARPTETYGRPDWDLIFRTFVDAGATHNDVPAAFDRDHVLVGTGVGLEFQLRQNIDLRADWGIALTDVNGTGYNIVKAGSNRFHFSFTFLY